MGFGINIAEIIAREHKRRPLGHVLLLGRQTMYFSPQVAIDLLKDIGISIPKGMDAENIQLDKDTLVSKQQKDLKLISDKEFFKLLECKVSVLDHSDYECADVIHDLNLPIPAELESSFDFVVDGSTLDNVFNPCATLQNVNKMLRPGGRIIAVNMGSNHNTPYTILTPMWFLDYFVTNKFLDCHVYVAVITSEGAFNLFLLDYNTIKIDQGPVNFTCDKHQLGIFLFAEKGPDSTWDAIPSQQHYRSNEEWQTYFSRLEVIKTNSVAPISYSGINECLLENIPYGYQLLVNKPEIPFLKKEV